MSAVDLLTTFSGEDASRIEPAFRFSEASRITGVEIHAAGMESSALRYSGKEPAQRVVQNILRITTADGLEGVSGVDTYHEGAFSDAHLRELERVVPDLLRFQTLDPLEAGEELVRSYPDLVDAVRSSIDIALWDLASRRASCPLCELLGANRRSMAAYASLPFFETLEEHLAAVERYAERGFRTFKFHVWGSIEEDRRLVEALTKRFAGGDYRFMIDLEEKYDFEDAVRLGQQMDPELFVWLESPLNDEWVDQYASLREAISVPAIPDGNRRYSPDFIIQGIAANAWDAGRFDATQVGGLSTALELLIVANAAGLGVEIQSWGHALSQAANLHLALANERTRYFEAPTPMTTFRHGVKEGVQLADGMALVPDAPGLGLQVDWDELATADLYVRVKSTL